MGSLAKNPPRQYEVTNRTSLYLTAYEEPSLRKATPLPVWDNAKKLRKYTYPSNVQSCRDLQNSVPVDHPAERDQEDLTWQDIHKSMMSSLADKNNVIDPRITGIGLPRLLMVRSTFARSSVAEKSSCSVVKLNVLYNNMRSKSQTRRMIGKQQQEGQRRRTVPRLYCLLDILALFEGNSG
jgi:hypothetical protein